MTGAQHQAAARLLLEELTVKGATQEQQALMLEVHENIHNSKGCKLVSEAAQL